MALSTLWYSTLPVFNAARTRSLEKKSRTASRFFCRVSVAAVIARRSSEEETTGACAAANCGITRERMRVNTKNRTRMVLTLLFGRVIFSKCAAKAVVFPYHPNTGLVRGENSYKRNTETGARQFPGRI